MAGARSRRHDLEQVDGVRQDLGGRGRGRGLSPAQSDAAGGRDLERRAGEPDRRPGPRARVGRARQRQHLLDARRRGDDRPHLHGARGPPQWSQARRAWLWTLEPALLRRSLSGRALDPHQRDVVRSRGHHAAGLRSADGLSQSRTDPAVDAPADEPGRYRSRKPRPLRRRQTEARRDGAAGSRRAERNRPRHDERRALSGSDAVRHGRALARRRGGRFRPALHLAALRCGGLPAAHRLRQRGQPAARARGGTATRDGRALGAGGQPDKDGAPAPD